MKFIKGEIYNVNQPGNNNIFMWGEGDSSYYINRLGYKGHFQKGMGKFTQTEFAILASPKEKEWLLACIQANRYVEFDKIKIVSYEIY